MPGRSCCSPRWRGCPATPKRRCQRAFRPPSTSSIRACSAGSPSGASCGATAQPGSTGDRWTRPSWRTSVPQRAVDERHSNPRSSARPVPCRAGALAAALPALLMSATAGADELRPFQARYTWIWHGRTVGESNLRLERTGATWTYSSRSEPRGLGRLLSERPKTVSVLRVTSAQVEPLSYKGDDGTGSTKRKVDVEYDWEKHRITGVYENTPVDLPPA